MRRGAVIGRSMGTWTAAFVATAAVAPVRLVDRADEAWMLWVMHRVAHGDVLYRDVYDVTTPLPAWLGAVVVRVTGSEMLTLRLLVAAVIAAEVAVACSIARRAGMQWRGQAVLAVGLVAFSSPMLVFTSFYTGSAVLGALVALRLLLWVLDAVASNGAVVARLVWVGVATAASFWCKPNIGLLALAAVAVTLAVSGGRAWRTTARTVGTVAGTFAAIGIAASVVVAATGAWSAFVDQVFRSKGEYLDVGFSYATAVERRMNALSGTDPVDARAIVWLMILAIPVVVAAVLAWVVWRAGRRMDAPLAAFVAFGIVGILGTVPRPGVNHLAATASLMITAAACATLAVPERVPTHRARRAWLCASTALVVVAAAIAVGAALEPVAVRVDHDVPHFSDTPVPHSVVYRTGRLRGGLADITGDEVFFVRKDAGFLHFRTGTHDPLPYDIAERSDFGGAGERGVIRRLARGEAPWVCLSRARSSHYSDDPLVPRSIERWVRANGEPVSQLAMCDLYRLRRGA